MMQQNEKGYAIVAAIILVSALVRAIAGKKTKAEYFHDFKLALAWLGILAVIFAGYAYRDDFKSTKLYASLVPGSARTGEGGSMEFLRSKDGHFHIDATVNGVSVTFMVDTGAGGIVLTKNDAEKLGFNLHTLTYDTASSTANGITRSASVELRDIVIGRYHTGAIRAFINEGDLDNSLLGMRFLDTMKSYRIEGDKLIVYPK